MTKIKLRFVDRFVDRHGKERFYFRRRLGPRVALPGHPGSVEFMEAYQQALDGTTPGTKQVMRGASGSFERLIAEYFTSVEFVSLRQSTQRSYRLVLERFALEHGHRFVRDMQRAHVKKIIANRAATPGAANDLLKKIRLLMNFAIDAGWRGDNPASRIPRFTAGEFHTWTEEEIDVFERRWPIGSRERTAFALHLYTGQRRSDVCRMAWPDLIDGHSIRVQQLKTGAKLTIKLHPHLRAVLAGWPRKHISIMTTAYGKPFSTAGYGNWFAGAITKAELPEHCVAHGLRKAAARRLAEAGCSANEIAAVTGHTTLKEVERYTRAADQERMADAAIGSLPEHIGDGMSQTSPTGLGNRRKK